MPTKHLLLSLRETKRERERVTYWVNSSRGGSLWHNHKKPPTMKAQSHMPKYHGLLSKTYWPKYHGLLSKTYW
ncbi:hypothetical protein OIU77_003090 [Salix suchowensis]|uniref:Uncharacterized protein n=1 Tax=Salix suchowensis TaxID=1278906 RepID=A0ABQ9B0R8_9ROSI|nr:hypothetical protein OIU77_003090 [Salix suchowensis]